MSAHRLLPLDPHPTAAGDSYEVAAEKRLSGQPTQTLWPHYENTTGQFATGIWAGEVGKWQIRYTEEEYCHILAGVSVVTDAAGHAVTVRAGDHFVIPAGFVGTWEVLEPTRKIYVIYEAGA